MRGSSVASVVTESWADGPQPLTPDAIRTVPASTAAASHSSSPLSSGP